MTAENKFELKQNERGFDLYEFIDRYNAPCSLQKSSLAFEECIWLGVDENRMHLTQDMAKALIPILQLFVDTGEISNEKGTGDERGFS